MDRVCGARQRVRPREATPFEEAPTIMTRRPRLTSRIRAVLVLVTALAAGRPESAAAFENGHELAKDCHVLKKRVVGIGQQIRIPNRKEALLCWGYIQAMQDLVMLTTPTIGSCLRDDHVGPAQLVPPICALPPSRVEGQPGRGGAHGPAQRLSLQSLRCDTSEGAAHRNAQA